MYLLAGSSPARPKFRADVRSLKEHTRAIMRTPEPGDSQERALEPSPISYEFTDDTKTQGLTGRRMTTSFVGRNHCCHPDSNVCSNVDVRISSLVSNVIATGASRFYEGSYPSVWCHVQNCRIWTLKSLFKSDGKLTHTVIVWTRKGRYFAD